MTELLTPSFAARLDRLDLLSRRILGGKLRGEHLGRRRGESMEFADFREYSAGDDPRFVDWNIFGRLDRLLIKLFVAEEEMFLHVVLDASASMDFGEPNKWDYLRQVAAALGYVGLVNRHHVRVWTISDAEARESELLRGRSSVRRLVRFLESVKPGGKTRFAETCRRLTIRREHRGVVVVLSDFLFEEDLQAGLGMLGAAGHEVFCVQALSPQETEPETIGAIRFADSESGEEIDVRVSERDIAAYKARLSDMCDRVENQVTQCGGRFMRTQTSVPFDLLVLEGLRRGGLVR